MCGETDLRVKECLAVVLNPGSLSESITMLFTFSSSFRASHF